MTTINIDYTIEKIQPDSRYFSVSYDRTGDQYPTLRKAFRTEDFSKSNLTAMAESWFPLAVDQWSYIESVSEQGAIDLDELEVGVKQPGSYTLPPSAPTEPTTEQLLLAQIWQIGDDRYAKETGGIVWTDDSGQTWLLDTQRDSQSLLTAAYNLASAGLREEGKVWKCGSLDDAGNIATEFRPTTNAEILQWSGLIGAHVQKCFDAESSAVEKANSGHVSADFETEFLAM